MIRKYRLSLLVSFFALLLVLACAGGGEEAATAAPAEGADVETHSNERGDQPPPDFDVKPGKGSGAAGEKDEATAEAGPTIWNVEGKPAPEGPESGGYVNADYLKKVESLKAYDLDSNGEPTGDGTDIVGFSLELTSGDRQKTLQAFLTRSGILLWNLTPDSGTDTLLKAREPDKPGQLPLEFFWNSDTLKVMLTNGTTRTAGRVECNWVK